MQYRLITARFLHMTAQLLQRFPNYQFKNNVVRHSYDIISFTPVGRKAFLWFTIGLGDKPACYLLYTSSNRQQIFTVDEVVARFDDRIMRYGDTILFGTMVKSKDIVMPMGATAQNNQSVFVAEDIMMWRGDNMSIDYTVRLAFLADTLNKYLANTKFSLSFAEFRVMMPVLTGKRVIPRNIGYTVYNILNYTEKGVRVVKDVLPNECVVMSITAKPEEDTYDVVDNMGRYVGNAAVQSYKTSMWLNGIFRNIRENGNLDYLEESENEDEFQNMADDKFIKRSEPVKFKCEFNQKFKKWAPIELVG